MLSIYPACFFEEEENHYSVIFPDFNYLSTCGIHYKMPWKWPLIV